MKKFISFLLILALCIPLISPCEVYGATKINLNKTKIELHEGETYTLKLKGATGTVKWSSSKKSVATVSSKGKVKAVKKGKATITATYKNKKYKCTVNVLSGKKVDVIFTAYISEGTSLEDYVKYFEIDDLDFLDTKVYDDQHIAVTMYETDRKDAVKALKNNHDILIDTFLSKIKGIENVFTDIEADELFQNIKLYTNKETYENSYIASVTASVYFQIISDAVQAFNLVEPKDRVYNITVIDNATGKILS